MESNLKAHIEALRDSFQRELTEWASAQRSLQLRLNQLRDTHGKPDPGSLSTASREDLAEVKGRLQVLETKLNDEITEQACLREKEISELREALVAEARTREAVRDNVRDAVKRHLEDERAARELQNNKFVESLEGRLAQDRATQQQQLGLLKERLAKVDKLVDDAAERQTRDMEAVREKMRDELQGRLWEYHGSVRDPCAALKERVDHLEDLLGEAQGEDKHRREASPDDDAKGWHQDRETSHSPPPRRRPQGGAPRGAGARSGGGGGHGASVAERLDLLEGFAGETKAARAEEAEATGRERAKFKERFEAIERLMGEVASKMQQDVQAAHAKIDREGQARVSGHSAVKERLDAVQGSLQDAAGRHVALEGAHKKLQEDVHAHAERLNSDREALGAHHSALHERLGQLEGQLAEGLQSMQGQVSSHQDAFTRHYDIVREHLAAEKRGREAHESAVHEQFGQERAAREGHHVEVQENLAQHRETHDASLAALLERFSRLEAAVVGGGGEKAAEPPGGGGGATATGGGGAAEAGRRGGEGQGQGAAGGGGRGGGACLRARVDSLEKLLGDATGQSAQALTDAFAKIAQEHGLRSEFQSATAERLDRLEQHEGAARAKATALETMVQETLGQLADAQEKGFSNAQARLREEFQGQLTSERSAREAFHATVQEHISNERKARVAHHSEVNDRVNEAEQKLGEDVATLREQVAAESHARVKHYEAVQEHLAQERRARETHEKNARAIASEDREAREAHERLLRERLSHEQEAREKHQEHVRSHISAERSAREAQHQRHQEHAKAEGAAREEVSRKVQEALAEERSFRDHHIDTFREFAERERAARKRFEERVATERRELEEQQHSLGLQVKELKQDFDLLRTGASEAAPHERLAKAVDVFAGRPGRGSDRPTRGASSSRNDSPRQPPAAAAAPDPSEPGLSAAVVTAPGSGRHSSSSRPGSGRTRGGDRSVTPERDVQVQHLPRPWPPPPAAATTDAAHQHHSVGRVHADSHSAAPGPGKVAAGAAQRAASPSGTGGCYGGTSYGLPAQEQHMSMAGTGATGSYSAAPMPGSMEYSLAPLMGSSTGGRAPSPDVGARTISQSPNRNVRRAEVLAGGIPSRHGPQHPAQHHALPQAQQQQHPQQHLQAQHQPYQQHHHYQPQHQQQNPLDITMPPAGFRPPAGLGSQLAPCGGGYGERRSLGASLRGTSAPPPGSEEPLNNYFSGPAWGASEASSAAVAAAAAQGSAAQGGAVPRPMPLALPIEARTRQVHQQQQPPPPQHPHHHQQPPQHQQPASVAAAPPVSIPSHVPRLLCVESPNGHMSCIGDYALVPGELRNGFPLWKQKAGDRWLFSGTNGKWYIAGAEARDRDFCCQSGLIHSGLGHGGLTPDQVAGPWIRKYGAEYHEDREIRISAADAGGALRPRPLRLE